MESTPSTTVRRDPKVYCWLDHKTLINSRELRKRESVHWKVEHDFGPDSEIRMAEELAIFHI